ncbi:hypothetical protein Q9966_012948 [Columba livia]|nr:hypothetical protein Q9966_012948 [Columba livia]
MGRLSRYLARGEYGQLRDCPLFESDFLQALTHSESMLIKLLGVILFLSLGAIPGRSILWKASRSDHCTPPHPQFANHTYPMDTIHPNSLAFWQVEAVLICSPLAKS